jgi:hypothetical protein
VKLPTALSWQPEGGDAEGAMPSWTAWARPEAAKRRGAKTVEVRMVRVVPKLPRKGWFGMLLVKWMPQRMLKCSMQEDARDAVVGNKDQTRKQTDTTRYGGWVRGVFFVGATLAPAIPASKDSACAQIKLYLQVCAASGIATRQPSHSGLALDER